MAKTKIFDIEAVLSVITGHLFSTPGGAKKLAEILSFMTGCDLTQEQVFYFVRATKVCKPFLQAQFPQFLSLGFQV